MAIESLISKDSALIYEEGGFLVDRIHYACGHNVMSDWVNTDFFDEKSYPDGVIPEGLAGNIYHVDLASRQPFPDAVFKYAYSEDFIEHLMLKDAITFLFEVRRCLSSGGVFRVSTPGFHEVMSRHYSGKTFNDLGREHQDAFDDWGHYNFFSHETLKSLSEAAGFSEYKVCDFGVSEHDALSGVDTRFRQIGLNIIAEMKA